MPALKPPRLPTGHYVIRLIARRCPNSVSHACLHVHPPAYHRVHCIPTSSLFPPTCSASVWMSDVLVTSFSPLALQASPCLRYDLRGRHLPAFCWDGPMQVREGARGWQLYVGDETGLRGDGTCAQWHRP